MERLRVWLFEAALPACASAGFDQRSGAFVEQFSIGGTPVDPGFRRVRVLARQIYVYSVAALRGARGADRIAALGHDYLLRHAARSDGGWVRLLSSDGSVIDATLDLYDVSFVLLALAHWGAASGDRSAFLRARRTLLFVRARLRHASGLGYHDAEGPAPSLQQNPHMHLFEACLALALASGDDFFLAEANHLHELAQSRLVDSDGALPEIFVHDWRPSPQDLWIEPGHQFEWASLLDLFGRLSGSRRPAELAARLLRHARRHGLSPGLGLVYDRVAPDGTVVMPTFRLWPQLERLRAQALTSVPGDSGRHDETAPCISSLFQRFLDPAPLGFWIDRLDDAGRPASTQIPASSLYHLVSAITALLDHRRVEQPLAGQAGFIDGEPESHQRRVVARGLAWAG